MDQNPEPSPWTRPGFVAAAVLVAVIAVVGIVLAITNGGDDTTPPAAAPVQTTSGAATTTPSGSTDGDTDSVCGLKGTKTSGRLSKAPDAEWDYQGTAAYPVSKEHGPGRTDPTGYRYCYQRSPEGALFAASYAAIVGTDPAVAPAWINYIAAPGRYREALISSSDSTSSSGDIRIRVAGFRVLAFTGDTAKVDVAMVVSTGGQALTMSAVYPLVWSDGDWKISSDTPEPGNVVGIPNLAGYIPWGE